MHKLLLVIILLFAASMNIDAAKPRVATKARTIKRSPYIEYYSVLASDTSLREGKYELKYKGKTIEKGQYHKGNRVGKWEFRNVDNSVELCFDYDDRQPFNIMPHVGKKYDARNFPPIFLGSPLVPYHFFALKATLPKDEEGTYNDCKVVIALEINNQGRMTGYRIIEKSENLFNNIVEKIAKEIPVKQWEWVPARKDGKNIASDYIITIVFDVVERE